MERFSDDFICYLKQTPVEDRRSVRAVLWPVHVWQVYGPDLSRKRTNIFERSLLSLFSIGTGKRIDKERVNELAKWHGLEPEMVTYIIEQQLEPKGWLDTRSGSLTKEGIKALQHEVSGPNSLRIGYVFQDAVAGGMFPRYASTLNLIEPVSAAGPQLAFSLSIASNWQWKPLLIQDRVGPAMPSREELRGVMRGTHEAQRNAWMMGAQDEYESVYQLDALQLSDKEPFTAYLWVWVYSSVGLVHPWAAADPLGLHCDVQWMREKIEGVCKVFPKLSREIIQLISLGGGNEFSSLEDALATREEQAKLEVLAEYSQAGLVDRLMGLLHGWSSRKLDVETSEADNRYHDYRDLITQSSGVIEHCVRYCLEKYPLQNPHIIPRNCGRTELQELISAAVPALSEIQIEEVIRVRHSAVFNTAKNRQGSFRLCMAASLLSMPDYSDHPLREVVLNEQHFLDAYRLSHWRDGTAHADGGVSVSKSKSLEAASITASFLKIFFEGLNRVQK